MKQSKDMKFKWQKHFMHMSKSKMSRVLSQDSKHRNKTLRYFLLIWHICTDNRLSKTVYYILVMSLWNPQCGLYAAWCGIRWYETSWTIWIRRIEIKLDNGLIRYKINDFFLPFFQPKSSWTMLLRISL